MIRHALSALTLVALFLPVLDDPDAAWKAGGRCMEDKDYKNAIVEFTKVLNAKTATDERKAAAAFNIGCCHGRLNNKQKALEFVVKAIELGFSNDELLAKEPAIKDVRGDARIKSAVIKLQKEREEKFLAHGRELLDGFEQKFNFDFDLPTVAGKRVALSDFAGKVLIVDIWGTWCGPCKMELPHFIDLYKKYKDSGLAIVGLNDEKIDYAKPGSKEYESTKENIVKFAKNYEIPYPLAMIDRPTESQVPHLAGFPTTLFFDRTGKVRLQLVGAREKSELEAVVQVLMSEGASTDKPAKPAGDGKDAPATRPVPGKT
ncbi:MAG: TlpA family protein disulfide reductase [Planctomycetes bacterium]|nr:TlpA family protein disulfide reductase [Planctomycetota bacterium]